MEEQPEIYIGRSKFLDTVPGELLVCRFCGSKAVFPDTDAEGTTIPEGTPFGSLEVKETYTQ